MHASIKFLYNLHQFQFHKGAINTNGVGQSWLEPYRFQFHKGTINTIAHINVSDVDSYFNSIKVQLIHNTCANFP